MTASRVVLVRTAQRLGFAVSKPRIAVLLSSCNSSGHARINAESVPILAGNDVGLALDALVNSWGTAGCSLSPVRLFAYSKLPFPIGLYKAHLEACTKGQSHVFANQAFTLFFVTIRFGSFADRMSQSSF